ncbi:MAG: DUF2130 domain-containing protein [Bacteroidales bacterium]|nr:DUF2130 domain-containing protein [Bacteroidales bacterium]MBN2699655.1 DUF2130 domain-containing protein [Bacteroidales bacterium]
MDSGNKIECPNCGYLIDVNELLYHQLEEEIRKGFNKKLADEQKKFQEREEHLVKEKEALGEQRKLMEEAIRKGVDERVKSEMQKQRESIMKQLAEEQSEEMSALKKELLEKSEKVKELSKSKAEIERLKREKEEMKEELGLQLQKQLNEKIMEERERIRKAADEQNELKFREYEKKLADQKKLMDQMQRKYEQGSMQMQGEVQELAIEEWLASSFPLDEISEIKKGARGADCLQTVHTYHSRNCGKIYYESKRTKDFQPSWIGKFKQDMRDKGADIGVLVTEAMPADMERMGLKDGIWICTFEEFKALSNILRESVIRISDAVASNENKGDKMSMLYNFLTSNEFRMQIEAIVEGFTQMKEDLESEKRSMQRIWKSREKQIEKVITNTIDMYGSIKGIAGSAIGTVRALELPGDKEQKEIGE